MFRDSGRKTLTDQSIIDNMTGEQFTNKLFIRLVSKDKTFRKVDFKYCIFDQAYLRKCKFIDCDFTGAKFQNSNLLGSTFEGCKFAYSSFDKTLIDDNILQKSCPSEENLKIKFARALRVNFQQLGDAKSANIAISIELQATEEHLYKSWHSNEFYYRRKYTGLERIKAFIEWLNFKILDYTWGNGESTWKLIRSVSIILIFITVWDTAKYGKIDSLSSYFSSLIISPQILFGVIEPLHYSKAYLTLIYVIRLILFGFFMSIIIKRFNRR